MPAEDIDSLTLLDLDTLMANVGDDPDFLQELIGLFSENAESSVAQIEQAAAKGEWAVVGKAAHSLKGAAGGVSATRVYKRSAHLEMLARTGEVGDAPSTIAALRRDLDATKVHMASLPKAGG